MLSTVSGSLSVCGACHETQKKKVRWWRVGVAAVSETVLHVNEVSIKKALEISRIDK